MREILYSLLFLTICLPAGVRAAEMRIYNFTSAFINCVKQHDAEGRSGTVDGNSDSGLMNGSSVIGAGQIKGNYWSYMSCLSKLNSGTSSQALPQQSVCNDISISSEHGVLYVPPGTQGKVVSIKGYSWVCENGSWSPSDEPESRTASCPQETMQKNTCTFTFKETAHGQSAESWFGSRSGNVNATSEGHATASCLNGDWTVTSSVCVPSSCQSGEVVGWMDPQTGAYCSGAIEEAGSVAAETDSRIYFPTLDSAKLSTRITTGQATFACVSGRWVMTKDPSSCVKKKPEQLLCDSVASADGTRKYFCE